MFRDFLMLLRRYTASSILNIIGMALAFASAYIILVQVNFDMSYDRKIPNAENIYRMDKPSLVKEGMWSTLNNRYDPSEVCEHVPGIIGVTSMSLYSADVAFRFVINRPNGSNTLKAKMAQIERSGLDVFSFTAVAGLFDQFIGPSTAIISASYAKQHGLAVGDVLHSKISNFYGLDAKTPITIVAIYKDFPSPGEFSEYNLFLGMPPIEQSRRGSYSYRAFVRLQDGVSPTMVTNTINNLVRLSAKRQGISPERMDLALRRASVRLSNLKDLYFLNNIEYAGITGNRSTTYTLLGVAILIIVIACINFFNFFLALAPARIRAFNTRKVFGGSNLRLRLGFMTETLGLIILALLIGAVLVLLFADSSLADYLTISVFAPNNLILAMALISLALLLGVLICLYPAYYITSFPPALVTKGDFQASPSGVLMRNILIGFQFIISTVLIIMALFINLQHRYMMHYDMGFQKDELLTVLIKPFQSYAATDAFVAKLKQNPMIIDAAFATGDFVTSERPSNWIYEHDNKLAGYAFYSVSWNFLKVMGIDVVEGRDFTKDDEKRNGVYIFNEEAKRQLELKLDQELPGHNGQAPIIGFCKDFHSKPLQYGLEAFAFYVMGAHPWDYPSHAYIRVAAGTNYRDAMDYIHKTVLEFDPSLNDNMIQVQMFDDELEVYYEAEERLAKLITIFTLLSVVISIIGVFGLVLFETQYRRKEIGIRRVHGASVQSILKMFNLQFLRITLICAAVAIPISYYFVDRWLTGFTARMPMSWWIFALAVVIICLIVIGTVTARSWKTANENPINSIQH